MGYRSLVGGYYSNNPSNLSLPRSVRTNNPGALNVSAWQRKFRGYAGVTKDDGHGNVTTIYYTPEHGIAAWHYLMTDRYGFGDAGEFTISGLAMRYAGVTDPTSYAIASYVHGWTHWANGAFDANTTFQLDQDSDMVTLGLAMFSHEAGEHTPLSPKQITYALELLRDGNLPPN